MIINLLSDTVTKPTPGMLEAMFKAEVGDDVFNQDPTVNKLQSKVSNLFKKEAALFCPSGTMTNQLAIKAHTNPLDEMICDQTSHVYQYENGGYSFHSGISIRLIHGINGKLTPEDIRKAINPHAEWYPHSKLVVIENTCNKAGGGYYTLEEMAAISETCKKHHLKLHLDGARIFNALTEIDASTQEVGALFDSISICLSKGLGAPVGSLLIGNNDFIFQARRFRKVMGGAMRQSGYLAAAGIYALDHHIDRLTIDHQHAKKIEQALLSSPLIKEVLPVYTNIIVFKLQPEVTAKVFIQQLANQQISAIDIGENTIRFVLHLDITSAMVSTVCSVLKALR